MPTAKEMNEVLFRAWDQIYPRAFANGLDSAAPDDRVFAAVWTLQGEVDNGGFAQYLCNDTSDYAEAAREALVVLEASLTLAVFNEFLARLPGGHASKSRDAREAQLEELVAQRGDVDRGGPFGDLDKRFYAAEDELRERLFAFATTRRLV
jgi:hypothetical protein